jgi:phage portal protein BeeE
MERTYSGSANAGKPLILEEGMEWQQLGMTNEDAQFLQTRQFGIPAIARRFRVPLVMIGSKRRRVTWGPASRQSPAVS